MPEIPLRENNNDVEGTGSENVSVQEESSEVSKVLSLRGSTLKLGDLEVRKDSLTLGLIVGLIIYEMIE